MEDWKYACMHDRNGYFVGRWVMGRILRLSVEHYEDEQSCLLAIREKRWTRRNLLQ